jgi:hypothetical protein
VAGEFSGSGEIVFLQQRIQVLVDMYRRVIPISMGRSIDRQDGEDFKRCVSGHFFYVGKGFSVCEILPHLGFQCSVKTFNDTGFGKEVHVVFFEKRLKYSVDKFSSFVCL